MKAIDAGIPTEIDALCLIAASWRTYGVRSPEAFLPRVLGYVWEPHPMKYAYRLRPA